ncbi:unnamed protein product [Cladocopium goreaui]|uniref:PPM-type phosphatase domain-containing protein n=1 Tax=Cladocopium goreaui TaxID=2562237 RepID=A0A9P1FL42_9DINO|nr:unnamed protein product [Cladocopium goreaui]
MHRDGFAVPKKMDRPGGHLALGDSDGEHDNQDGASSFAPFAKEVYEGLFDRELMLRLDGVVLPEVPQPPLHLEGEDVGCALRLWAGAHLIKKAHGACEDAFFADPHGMGVADGVGCMVQFASYGINAAQYAAELMEFSSAALKPGGIASEDKIPSGSWHVSPAVAMMWPAVLPLQCSMENPKRLHTEPPRLPSYASKVPR